MLLPEAFFPLAAESDETLEISRTSRRWIWGGGAYSNYPYPYWKRNCGKKCVETRGKKGTCLWNIKGNNIKSSPIFILLYSTLACVRSSLHVCTFMHLSCVPYCTYFLFFHEPTCLSVIIRTYIHEQTCSFIFSPKLSYLREQTCLQVTWTYIT